MAFAGLLWCDRLYVGARLVHGDLNEQNILVAPAFQVANTISSAEDSSLDLQAVFIDFGQAVDLRHPESLSLLNRDLARIRSFFTKQGVKTLTTDESMEFVVDDFDNGNEDGVSRFQDNERAFKKGQVSYAGEIPY
jgi:serine/threonine-protein kinase RIO1